MPRPAMMIIGMFLLCLSTSDTVYAQEAVEAEPPSVDTSSAAPAISINDPLYKAIMADELSAVRRMTNEETDVNASFADGSYPIIVASEHASIGVIKVLTALGAKTKVKDAHGRTPMHYAAMQGDLEKIKYLLAFGAEADTLDEDNISPLYYAYMEGHLHVADYLVREENAKVNRTDKDGYLLAFEIVEKEDRPDIIQHMVSNGLNIFKRDAQDLRLMDIAKIYDHMQSYHILNAAYQQKIQEFYRRLTSGNEGRPQTPGQAPGSGMPGYPPF